MDFALRYAEHELALLISTWPFVARWRCASILQSARIVAAGRSLNYNPAECSMSMDSFMLSAVLRLVLRVIVLRSQPLSSPTMQALQDCRCKCRIVLIAEDSIGLQRLPPYIAV